MPIRTRDFTSDAEVAELVRGFEEASVTAAEFTHTAHIAVALAYLHEMPVVAALERMREKIRAFAAHHGVPNLYHETLTVFWMRLLGHLTATSDHGVPLYQRTNRIIAEWGTRRPVDAHYTRELIASEEARARWIPPDRLPLPF